MYDTGGVTDGLSGTIRELSFPFTVSPSGGDLAVFAAEERRNAYVLLCGYTPSLNADERQECVALVTIGRVSQLRYGYPNEEAFWKDPRGKLDHGVFEIVGSGWREAIDSYNRASFGTDWWHPDSSPRHFFIGSKDSSAQFLASEIELEIYTDTPLRAAYAEARQEALRRLDADPEP